MGALKMHPLRVLFYQIFWGAAPPPPPASVVYIAPLLEIASCAPADS